MRTIKTRSRTKRRAVNKAMDRRFAMRNQRPPLDKGDQGGKSLLDLPDTPRRRRVAKGVRRVQLGRTLPQGELADRDPVRD
jgi:hypothetical protein